MNKIIQKGLRAVKGKGKGKGKNYKGKTSYAPCPVCGKTNHTEETCWKKHGKPSGKDKGKANGKGKSNTKGKNERKKENANQVSNPESDYDQTKQ